MTIKVKQDRAYGNIVFYPICDVSKTFARIAGTKTLTIETLRLIKGIGYSVDVQQDKVKI